ncbi:ribonuclease H-like domain-containing protein [Tanacetum coccineum]
MTHLSMLFTHMEVMRSQEVRVSSQDWESKEKARVVLSEDDEVIEDDSSKQGRKLSDAEVQENAEVQEKTSTETEPIIQEVTPTEVIQDQGSSEKGNSEVSTVVATKGTASVVPMVSTAEVNISTAGRTVTYRRRSEEKRTRKDKGKAILTEPEPKKKSKKELEQERNEEIARQRNEEEGQKAMSEAKSSKKIDWNDPSVIRYHTLKMKPKIVAQARRNMNKNLKNQGNYKISDFKGMSYNEIRPIFEKVWDFNQHIEPMDVEHESEKMKSPEKIEEEDVDTQKEMKEVSKESGAKRKKSLPRKSTRSKRQKMEEDDEKEDLKGYLDIVPRDDAAEDVESLSTKGDGSSKNYKILSEMLEDFDRQDVEELYRLVKERYSASRPEGFDLMLWGDLYTLFEPDEENEIWKNQREYNLISWRLCNFCGIHILLMENGLAIHMLTEKKYPLSQEMLSKMLSKRLEVDHESSQAFELLRFGTLTFEIAVMAPVDIESKLGDDGDPVLDSTLYRGAGCVANAVVETCWLRNLLRELYTPLSSAILVYCDNVSAVYLSSNPIQHKRTKHIEIDIYFVRDLVAANQVYVLHVPSRYQYADIFNKGLPSALFEEFRTGLSVRCPPAQTVREC